MKVSASTPAERRRQWLLLGLLVVVGGVVYMQSGGAEAETPAAASNPVGSIISSAAPSPSPQAGQAKPGSSGGGLPQPLKLSALEPVPELASGVRNPFGFGVKPAPPPPPTPPPPVYTPRPTPTGPPPPPPIPPIPVKFVGFVEDPARPGKVVSLLITGPNGSNVVIAREGDLVDGRYRLVKVGLESIEMTYANGTGRQTIRLSGGGND